MKLSPTTIPFRALEVVFGLGWIALVVVIGAGTFVSGAAAAALAAVLVVAVVGGGTAYAIAYYRRFEYELTADSFDVHSGVFARRNREIPYHRIQNVSISKNVIHRLVGIAEVRIETAGGESAEVHLRFVADAEARRLQEEITTRKRGRAAERPDRAEREPVGPAEVLFRISPTELALLGVVSFDVRLVAIIIALLVFFEPETVTQFLIAVPAVVLAPAAIIAIYLVGAAVSGIVAVTNFWDFQLAELTDELRYRRGLLRQFSGSIPLRKIQSLTVSENVLARRFGYATLLIETAGFSPGETSGSQTAVPIATRERVLGLARSIEPFEAPAFTRVPKRARERYFFRYSFVVAGLTGVAFAIDFFGLYPLEWAWTLALLLAVPVAAHLKWLHLGYAVQDGYVLTRAGFWTRRIHVVPYHRVQAVFQSQTIFQRRRRLASVRIDTAGSRALLGEDARAIDLDVEDATALREYVHDRMQYELRLRRSGFQWLDEGSGALSRALGGHAPAGGTR